MITLSTILLVLLDPDTYIYIGWGILILLTVGLIWLILRNRKRWVRLLASVLTFLLWIAFLYGAYVGPRQFEVRHVEIAFDDLPLSFDGYTIVQFSDVHAGTMAGSRAELLERAVDSINAQQADLVVFTGDLQNKKPTELMPFVDLLSSIKAKDGVFSVKGNHDYPMYIDDEMEQLDDMEYRRQVDDMIGWTVLDNCHYSVRRGDEHICIAGMENDGDAKRFPKKGNIQRALSGIMRDEFVVMLEHDPTAWRRKILPECHAQLTLSGHTHGGQVSLFGLSPAGLAYKEYNGLYTIGGRYLHVSSGLSGVVPFRLGVTPEIVVITLRRNDKVNRLID